MRTTKVGLVAQSGVARMEDFGAEVAEDPPASSPDFAFFASGCVCVGGETNKSWERVAVVPLSYRASPTKSHAISSTDALFAHVESHPLEACPTIGYGRGEDLVNTRYGCVRHAGDPIVIWQPRVA